MDATQFQAAFLAWASAATVCIGALVGVGLALRSGIEKLRASTTANATAIAAVSTTVDHHEKALNGDLTPRVEAIADQRIALHRRPGDAPTPAAPPV